jgi:hypothetical protein
VRRKLKARDTDRLETGSDGAKQIAGYTRLIYHSNQIKNTVSVAGSGIAISRSDSAFEGFAAARKDGSNGRLGGNVDSRSRESRAIRPDTTKYRHPIPDLGRML